MRPTLIKIAGLIVLWLGLCSSSLAGDLAGQADWASCLDAPGRDCILDEALMRALLVGTAASQELGDIAGMQAAAGHLELAQRIARSIPGEQRARVIALAAIVRAYLGRGEVGDAEQTLTQAHRVADAIQDRLTRAEALLSIGQVEADAGMAAEASRTFSDSVAQADGVEIRAGSTCLLMTAPEDRLDGLYRVVAEHLAKAGDIGGSVRVARSIIYKPHLRSEALRVIGEIAAHDGKQSEAAAILRDAVDAARATSPQWPSCPNMNVAFSPGYAVDLLGEIAQAQARIGAPEDVNATLDLALQAISDIKDNAVWKAEVSRSLALSVIAETQRKIGQTSQAEVTFRRAAQTASEIENPKHRATALIRLARARHDDGHAADVTGIFNEALGLARALDKPAERAGELLNVVEAEVGLGLDAGPVLDEAIAAMRSIPEPSGRVYALNRIARAQDGTGHPQDGLASYTEALDTAEATENLAQRRNALFTIIRAWPGQPQSTRLVAASAPRLLRIIDATAERQSAAALVVLAKAVPQ